MSSAKEARREKLIALQPEVGELRLQELATEIMGDFSDLVKTATTKGEGSAIAQHRLLKRFAGFATKKDDVLIMVGKRQLDGYNVGMPGQGIRAESHLRIVPEVEIKGAVESLDEITVPVQNLPENDETYNPVINSELVLSAAELADPGLASGEGSMYKVVFKAPGKGFLSSSEERSSYLIVHRNKALAKRMQSL